MFNSRLLDLLREIVKNLSFIGATMASRNKHNLEVADITGLTDAQLDALQLGDKVAKLTGTARHLYIVTYKDAENGGICLSYNAAGYGETVSYDHSASGWTYNSTDIKTYGD